MEQESKLTAGEADENLEAECQDEDDGATWIVRRTFAGGIKAKINKEGKRKKGQLKKKKVDNKSSPQELGNNFRFIHSKSVEKSQYFFL